jgi:hypothetical protein
LLNSLTEDVEPKESQKKEEDETSQEVSYSDGFKESSKNSQEETEHPIIPSNSNIDMFRPVATPSIREVLSDEENDHFMKDMVEEREEPVMASGEVTTVVDQLGQEVSSWLSQVVPTRIDIEEEQ